MATVDMTGTTELPAPTPTTVFTPDHTPHTRLPAAPRRGQGAEGTVWHTERCTNVDECAEQLAAVMLAADENLNVLGAVNGAVERAKEIYKMRCGVNYPYDVTGVESNTETYTALYAAAAAAAFGGLALFRAFR